ncbi:MAG TPA: AAA family ATPase [Candidatus Aphodocola excrementigallinarum]|uniref:Chromosome partition protein Smc n=1 Tax=Candidatus Aphodocola excrementigallinarum TaxID=2840670 RepID=A0A9D1LIE5_9FIRM|nr:AAA family ATPase [Candidatus Aphodocola excrementigallinarum]
MYLKQIKASGFKSFAEKTVIDLTPGISGVVGPNGSGKSNIVDAVRWVLGEQSVKQLRGEGLMSDVIFSGSKSRKPASMASVTLVFDNTDKYLPVDYTEVSIKRCIYKTGENEYFLNNEKVRLKDIYDLLSDTGINKESFNIISQGDIASILSNKPEERRVIFEAAAGTLKYQKRKEEALRKLDRTHDNMNRINDIILELETNLEPLKKQSIDAKKYLENKKTLDEIEVSLIVSEVNEINVSYQNNKRLVNELNEEVISLEKNSNVDQTKIEKLKFEQAKKQEELYSIQNELTKVTEQAQSLLGKKDLIIERQKYDAKDSKVHENVVNIKESILRKENEIFNTNNTLEIINKKIAQAQERLSEKQQAFLSIKKAHDENEEKLTNQNRLENETNYKIGILRSSIENNSGLPYAVKCVLENPKLAGIHNVIGNLIETDKEYAVAIGVALSSASNYIVVDDEFSAKEAINYLKINKFGRATFFPLNIIKKREVDNETYRKIVNEADFVGVASSLVRYESVYDNIIKNQLGTTIVVTNLEAANALARKINYRYRIVTLDGELLHIGGSLTGGTLKNTTNIITQKHELEDNIRLLKSLTEKRKILEEKINQNDDKYKYAWEERQKASEEKTNLEISLRYETERQKVLKEELLKLKEEESNINSLINGTLSNEEEKVVEEYYEKEKQKKELEIKMESLKNEVNDFGDSINEMEKENKINNQEYYKKTKELKDLEIEVNRQDVRLDTLLNTLTDDYEMTFEKAKNNYFLDMDVKEAREKVDKCKLEIKKLGEVNIGAIEEYDRVSKRYDFLNNQKKDLENAENTILEIIKELDEIMKEKFLDTFNIIKEKFKEVFKKLFSGGSAELKLTNPDDILTTGIDIKALPPGKTLKHISLLSGGEKTLTAISLLFAILEARPVPFCILDEVEAALDEVNVDNFGKFLGEFKGKTQFIVITHKKKTMEYADVLYGVTMQESGVSKLVSVKLEDIRDDYKN